MESGFLVFNAKKGKFKDLWYKNLFSKGVVMSENLDSDENRTRYQRDMATCLYSKDWNLCIKTIIQKHHPHLSIIQAQKWNCLYVSSSQSGVIFKFMKSGGGREIIQDNAFSNRTTVSISRLKCFRQTITHAFFFNRYHLSNSIHICVIILYWCFSTHAA